MSLQITDISETGAKAKNHVEGTKNTLYSYNTKVAEYDTKTKEMQVFGYHSATTGRHINAFFKLFGLPTQTKAELFKNFNL
tara:strand:- start:2989 stop:3231 length:243 start_codon:yes stop_codon:yes gene_type:complete